MRLLLVLLLAAAGRFDILLHARPALTVGGWRRPSGNVLPL